MRKITLFAVAAAVIVATGFGVWATAPTTAGVTPSPSPSMSQGIEPFELMKNSKGLATAELVDYTFVFH